MNNKNKFTDVYIYYVSVSSQAVISNYTMYACIPCILLSTRHHGNTQFSGSN